MHTSAVGPADCVMIFGASCIADVGTTQRSPARVAKMTEKKTNQDIRLALVGPSREITTCSDGEGA